MTHERPWASQLTVIKFGMICGLSVTKFIRICGICSFALGLPLLVSQSMPDDGKCDQGKLANERRMLDTQLTTVVQLTRKAVPNRAL